MDNLKCSIFPSTAEERIALDYAQSKALINATPAEIYKSYRETLYGLTLMKETLDNQSPE